MNAGRTREGLPAFLAREEKRRETGSRAPREPEVFAWPPANHVATLKTVSDHCGETTDGSIFDIGAHPPGTPLHEMQGAHVPG